MIGPMIFFLVLTMCIWHMWEVWKNLSPREKASVRKKAIAYTLIGSIALLLVLLMVAVF